MPRVSTDTTDETTKRAPRKRAVRRVVTESETPVRKPRAPRTSRAKIEETLTYIPPTVSSRRAPTQLTVSGIKNSKKKYVLVVGLMTVMLAGAAWIGFSDVGQIDVTARINEQNQKKSISAEETNAAAGEITIPVQNTPPAAISNIRPRTDPLPTETPAPEVASTTAETASTTEPAVAGEIASTTEPMPAETIVTEPETVVVPEMVQ